MEKEYVYRKEIEIGKYYGKKSISLQEILRIFLETSRKHTVNLKALSNKNLVWMLYRWKFEIQKYPSVGEEVKVKTKVVLVDKLYAYREFIMTKDNVQIAKGMAQMVLVDKEKREITIIPEDLRLQSLEKKEIINKMKFSKYKILEDPVIFNFQYRDIDENSHMNNIAYFDYLIEYMASQNKIDFTVDEVSSANITYSKEILYPAKFKISTLSDNKVYEFSISSDDDRDIHASGRIELK